MIWKRLTLTLLAAAVLLIVGCTSPVVSDIPGIDSTTTDGDDTTGDGSGDSTDGSNTDSDSWFNDTPIDPTSSEESPDVYTVSLADLAGTYEYSDEVGNQRTLTIKDAGDVSIEKDLVGYDPSSTDYSSVSIDGFTMTADSDTYYILGDADGDTFVIADAVYGIHYPSGVGLADIFDDVTFGGVRAGSSYTFELATQVGLRGLTNLVENANDGWKLIFNEDATPEYFPEAVTAGSYESGTGVEATEWEFQDTAVEISPYFTSQTKPVEAEAYSLVITPADVSADAGLSERITIEGSPGDVKPGLNLRAESTLRRDASTETVDLFATFSFVEGQSIEDYDAVKIERRVPGFVWHEIESNVQAEIAEDFASSSDTTWSYEDTTAEFPRAYNYRMILVSPSGNEFVEESNPNEPILHARTLLEVEKTGNTSVDDNVGTFSVEALEHTTLRVEVSKPDGQSAINSEGRRETLLEYPDNSITVGPAGSGADYEVSDDNTDPTDYQVSFQRYFEFPDDPLEKQYFPYSSDGTATYTLYK